MGMAFDTAPFNEDVHMESEFLYLRDTFDIQHVVETGTYHGITTTWLAKHFDHVYTTEINDGFYAIAQTRFVNEGCDDKIRSYCMNSVEALPKIIDVIRAKGGNALFFLDAHWYQNPLIGELHQLSIAGYKPSVICIHDMMNPQDPSMGYDVYPDQNITYNYEFVKNVLEDVYGKDGFKHYFNKEATGARRGALFVLKTETNHN